MLLPSPIEIRHQCLVIKQFSSYLSRESGSCGGKVHFRNDSKSVWWKLGVWISCGHKQPDLGRHFKTFKMPHNNTSIKNTSTHFISITAYSIFKVICILPSLM